MAEYILVPGLTVADGPSIGSTSVMAFWEEGWWRIDWQNKRTKEQMIESFTARSGSNLLRERDIRRHQKVVHVPTGETVGYARWILPSSKSGEWLDAQVPDVSEEERQAFEKQRAEAFWSPDEKLPDMDAHFQAWKVDLAPKGDHMKLDYLACHPAHQRRGVANLLLASGMAQADRLALPVTIITMGDRARTAYERHGCHMAAENHSSLRPFVDGDYHTYWMVRPPCKAETVTDSS